MAWESLRANLLRSILTLGIIALGLMSLIGILTAIDGLLKSINDNFNRLGSNAFTVSQIDERVRSRTERNKRIYGKPISYKDAYLFNERYHYDQAKVGVHINAKNNAIARYRNLETDKNVRIKGINRDYLDVGSDELMNGRNFVPTEVSNGNYVIIIGSGIVKLLFNDKAENALGKTIMVDDQPYTVVGTLKEKGSVFGRSDDSNAYIPLHTARINYGTSQMNYDITVSTMSNIDLDQATSEAIGVMRNIRGLKPIDENDFSINKSSGTMDRLKSMTSTLRFSTIAIGLLTLMGAAIGLMNIMLVSVTERTKEIGVSKALGATSQNILVQFLTESIIITLIGGIIGIILGIIIGNSVSLLIGGSFIFPTLWVVLGFVLCLITGIFSGIYPAMKASRLDPIESLRHN